MSTACLEADFTQMEEQFNGVCRRQAPRFHFDLATVGYLAFPEGGSNQEVWLLDISELGIGFCSEWPLEVGTQVQLKLNGRAGKSATLRAKVVHSTKQTKGDWRIGCRFVLPLTPEMLDGLL